MSPHIHPSRFPGLVQARNQLIAQRKMAPEKFDDLAQENLDRITDSLLSSMAYSLARLNQEVERLSASARRPRL